MTRSELDDELELIEVSSGELLLGALMADVDDDDLTRDSSDTSSDGVMLKALLHCSIGC